jgi:hypothetical protein
MRVCLTIALLTLLRPGVVSQEVAQPRVINTCPVASIESASVSFDRHKELKLGVTIKNTGRKPIRAVYCDYRPEEETNSRKSRAAFHGGWIWRKPLRPGKRDQLTLFDSSTFAHPWASDIWSVVNRPGATLIITKVEFADGSMWALSGEVENGPKSQKEQP